MRRIKPPASLGEIHPFRLRLLDESDRKAACLGEDTNLFYPNPGDEDTIAEAKAICKGCPVKISCLEYAFEVEDRWAILGEMTPQERQRFKRQQQKARAA